MRAIFKRELQGYFLTPIGYVFIGIYLLLGGVFFIVGNLATKSTNLLPLLSNLSYLFMLLCPILTMRLFAQDKKQGVHQLLFSAPVSLTSIVLGKFFAACTVFLLFVIFSFIYPLLTALYGTLYLPETLCAYLGFVLLSMSFIALNLFVSIFTTNQVTCALLCFGVNLIVWLSSLLSTALHAQFFSDALRFISLYDRLAPFLMGQLSFSSLIFNVSFTCVMLFLCVRVLDVKRFKEG